MFQHPELIDVFISNQTGVEITPEFRESPEYKELYNLNKTDVNFNEGFVETVLGIHDAEFEKRELAKETQPEKTVEDYLKEIS